MMAVASSSPSGDVKDRLESVKENIQILSKQIKSGGATHYVPSSGSNLMEVMVRLVQCSKVLSADCTRLAVVFHEAPSPSVHECGVVCQKVEQSALQLTAAFYQLHSKHGKCLWNEVQKVTVKILDDLDNLVAVIMKEGCSKSPSQLRSTGGVWSSCDAVEKLSKDNKSAAVKLCLAEVHLLRDAATETDNLRSSNGMSEEDDLDFLMEDDQTVSDLTAALQHTELGEKFENGDQVEEKGAREWTEEERKLVEPCTELIKLSEQIAKSGSKLLLMHGDSKEERSIAEMDTAVDAIQLLSPIVDDLASDLPAPLDFTQCRKQGKKLGETLLSTLQTLSECHFCTKAGTNWEADKHKLTITNLLKKIVR